MSLVDEQAELVAPSQGDEAEQVAHGALHGVETLDDDEDVAPGPMGAGLSLGDDVTQDAFEVGHVVVLEHLDHGAGETGAEADGRVI